MGLERLRAILLAPLVSTERTRRRQALFDRWIDGLRADWDATRGLLRARGVALPHETVPDFWELSLAEQQAARSGPSAWSLYQAARGRVGTAPGALTMPGSSRHCAGSGTGTPTS